MECKNCGANVGNEYRLCPYCGTELEYPKNENSPTIVIQNIINNNTTTQTKTTYETSGNATVSNNNKNKIVALILCVLFGMFGAHCFYVGKTKTGIIYLFTFGLFGIGWIKDIISIANGTYKDSRGQKIR